MITGVIIFVVGIILGGFLALLGVSLGMVAEQKKKQDEGPEPKPWNSYTD